MMITDTNPNNRHTVNLLAEDDSEIFTFDLPDPDFDIGTMNPDYDHPHFREVTPAGSNDDHLLSDEELFDLDEPDTPIQTFLWLVLGLLMLPIVLFRTIKRKVGAYKLKRAMERSPAFGWVRANMPPRVRRGKIKLSDLSADKRYILENMTDDEVGVLLADMLRKSKPVTKETEEAQGDLQLDADTMAKVRAYREKRSRLDAQETRWLTTVETLLHCKFQKPQGFDGMTPQQIYHKLYDYLTAHHLPEEFIRGIVPALVYYVVNGEMRKPLMIVGSPGAGKTTAIKVMCAALGMVSYHFDAVSRDSSHGLLGEGKSFQSCENGELVYGVCKTGYLNPVMHIDEPEKTSNPMTRTAFQDDLLSLVDGSHEDYTDNFLRFPLPLRGIIFMFTVNSTDNVSAPLLDRCEVVRFKDIEEARVEDIIVDYARDELQTLLYKGVLELDDAALRKAVASLYGHGIHSVRQHQKMVDKAFRAAFDRYVFQSSENHTIVVDDTLYSKAMEQGDYVTVKKAGF